MKVETINQVDDNEFSAAVIVAEGVKVAPTPDELTNELKELVAKKAEYDFPEQLRSGIRDILRKGGFKPTGRNKPASEYLFKAAKEDRFPFINNLVDINNYLSLESGLPMSLLDLDRVGEPVVLRCGHEGESFVFNPSGQVIDVSGLICVCRKDGPALGNPVKDSMEAKIKDETSRVVGVVFSSKAVVEDSGLETVAAAFADMLKKYASATGASYTIV